MEAFMAWMDWVNGYLWHANVLYVILGVGVLFTVWSGFCQYRALTHGVGVVRGKFDDKDDPGAINHFQALSTALSATVGLGNIAGVALAVSLGGPGAVFWMWVTGLVGMALKTTEVTQALLYRNTDDPENPSGGAMWVASRGMAKMHPALKPVGMAIAVIFCITLLVSAITGGNMFQAWNVADITWSYFGVSKYVTGIVMTLVVGLVIVGGIKRIGDVTGRLVPLMCMLYLLTGIVVVLIEYQRIPEMFRLIFTEAFNPTEAQGAFIGGAVGWTFLKGMQRSLFSSEAGQGSSPIAHSAAKTAEPVREGIVAGLEPFVDTLVVCTITAFVILLSGQWNRDPDIVFDSPPAIIAAATPAAGAPTEWTLTPVTGKGAAADITDGQDVYAVVKGELDAAVGTEHHKLLGSCYSTGPDTWRIEWRADGTVAGAAPPVLSSGGAYFAFRGATLTAKSFDRAVQGLGKWLVPIVAWMFAISTMISWSYYGEQGMRFMLGERSIMPYRIVYCLLIFVAATPLIAKETELDVLSTLGTGVMLFANIPIMLIFGRQAMKAYKQYFAKLDRGEFKPHAYPKLKDVVEGHDVE
jgi:AGCS family alanine or glycine:cation symporter